MAGREVRAGKAFVEITLRDKLQAGLQRAAARMRAFASVTSAMGLRLLGASAAIVGPLLAMTKQFADAGDAVHKMALRTGLSAEAISQLGHSANLSGADIQTVEKGVRRMQQTVVDATEGVKLATDALGVLGLSAADLVGLGPEEQLAILADRFAALEDPALRTAAAMDIFGRAGTQLLPMFAGGAAGIQAMRDQADALGMTISTDAAGSAAALTDALGTMWSAVKALSLNIGSALAPVITEAANRMSAAVASITKFIQKNQQLIVIVAGVGAAIGAAGMALLAIGGTAAVAAFALSGLASLIGLVGTVIAGIGAAVGALLTPVGLVVTAVVAAAGAWLHFSGTGVKSIRWLQTRFGQLVGFVRKVAGGIGNALMAGDLQLAARIAWAAIKVAFFRGVQEVGLVWNRLSATAAETWNTLTTSAAVAASQIGSFFSRTFSGVGQTLIDTLSGVTGLLGQVFRPILQSGQVVASGFTSAFGQVKNATIESLSAIGTALAHGDFALAGEIAWTSIRLAFAQGIAWVTGVWTEFTTGLAMIWDGAVTTIRQVFSNVVSWIAKAILKMVEGVRQTLAALEEFDPTGLAGKLREKLTFDVEAAIGAVEQDRLRTSRGLDQARRSRDEDRVRSMQERLAATEQRLADLRAKRDEALARARSLAEDAGEKESPLASAMAELEKALDEAAKAPKLFDAGAATSQVEVPLEDLSAKVETTQKLAAQGTFNPFAIRGLGAESLAEKQLKATEKVADNTTRLLREAQHGGLVFE